MKLTTQVIMKRKLFHKKKFLKKMRMMICHLQKRYVLTSATWVTGAFNKVAKAAGEVEQQTKEKVEKAVKSVKVSNLSLGANDRDVREFFSFSGDIVYVETQSYNERSQIAFVTFTDCQGAETAVLLSPDNPQNNKLKVVMEENKNLQEKCSEFVKTEQGINLKSVAECGAR